MSFFSRLVVQTYNIGIIRRDISELINDGIKAGEICWLKHKYRDRYFADPFLWYQDDNNFYVLVEEYLFWEEKGKITLLKIRKNDFSLIKRRVMIEEETHLSFPFCEENGNVVIPESVKSGKCVAYTVDRNSLSVTKKEVLADFGTIDQTFFRNDSGDWMLTCLSESPKEELFIYKLGAIITEPIKNPVVTDIKYARSAGRLVLRNNTVYRPVQDSTGRYGFQTRIIKINKLDDDGYKFDDVITINGKNNPPYNETLHTLNAYDGFCIVDGSKDYFRPMKILYKKSRWMFKLRKEKDGI